MQVHNPEHPAQSRSSSDNLGPHPTIQNVKRNPDPRPAQKKTFYVIHEVLTAV